MNRIVLIGNGFDLAHGLPTRYEDFINDYWKSFIYEAKEQQNAYDNKNVSIVAIDETLARILPYDDKKQTYKAIVNNVNVYNLHTSSSGISFEVKNKILHQISKIDSLKTWVDIENEYYKFLCYSFDEEKYKDYKYDDIKVLNSDFEYIKQKLIDYLRNLDKKIEISQRICDVIYAPFNLDEFTEDAKIKWIKDHAFDIKVYNPIYNREVVSSKTVKLLEKIPTVDEEFLKIKTYDRFFWKEYFDLRPNDIMFLNFNYTNLEEPYIDKKKPVDDKFIPLDIHIHGELNNPSNPIIFGYGDELEDNYKKLENLQDNNYLENIKSIKYLETDNYKRILDFINSDKYQIIILGHSCGNSDRTLLNTLFEHENCVSIKPYYYQYQEGEVIKDNYSEIVRNISRSFTDKKSMRDKVVNKTYTDWFSTSVITK